jgi:hypothetical protein
MMLTKAECIARFELIDHLFRCVGEVDRNVLMFVYGSFSSYLSLPESDVDLTVVTFPQYRYILKVQRHIRVIFERCYGNKVSRSKVSAFKDGLVDFISLRCVDDLSPYIKDDGRLNSLQPMQQPLRKVNVCSACGSIMLGGNCNCSIDGQVDGEWEGARTIEVRKDGQGNYREWNVDNTNTPFSPSFLKNNQIKEVGESRVVNNSLALSSSLESVLDFSNPLFFYTNQSVTDLLASVSMPRFTLFFLYSFFFCLIYYAS